MPRKILHIIIIIVVGWTAIAANPSVRETPELRRPDYIGFLRIGNIFLQGEKYDLAMKYFQKAILVNSEGDKARYGYINALLKSGEPERALEVVRPLLKDDSSNPWYNFAIGEILESTDKIPGALYYFSRASKTAETREQKAGAVWYLDYLQQKVHPLNLDDDYSFIKTNYYRKNSSGVDSGPMKVAIFPAENANAIEKSIASKSLIESLIECGCCEIIKPEVLKEIIHEQALDIFETFDEETAVNLGKLIGLDAIVMPKFSYSNNYHKIHVQVLETENGGSLMAAGGAATAETNIRTVAKSIGQGFANAMLSLR
ncbi:MAG: tetratricopeptide repeat protein [candidate division Zixibacteria bacterium]|nr:tetratricopeptide repeat protein [candidate division Zixibacteria bacterium]